MKQTALLDSRKGDRQQPRTLFSRVPTWPRCLLTALLAQSVSDITSGSTGFCQVEGKNTPHQDPETAIPLPQRVYRMAQRP